MAEKEKISRRTIIRIVLLAVLMGTWFWLYWQLSLNYQIVTQSNVISESLLEDQALLARAKAKELSLVRENLRETEYLLGKLRQENEKLRQKIVLLDQVADLKETIDRLKEKNAMLINHIASVKEREPDFDKTVKTTEDGRSLLQKYRGYIYEVKQRIRDIRRKEHEQKVAIQKEQDRIESMIGNNGYMVRNGENISIENRNSLANSSIKVDVQFVK